VLFASESQLYYSSQVYPSATEPTGGKAVTHANHSCQIDNELQLQSRNWLQFKRIFIYIIILQSARYSTTSCRYACLLLISRLHVHYWQEAGIEINQGSPTLCHTSGLCGYICRFPDRKTSDSPFLANIPPSIHEPTPCPIFIMFYVICTYFRCVLY